MTFADAAGRILAHAFHQELELIKEGALKDVVNSVMKKSLSKTPQGTGPSLAHTLKLEGRLKRVESGQAERYVRRANKAMSMPTATPVDRALKARQSALANEAKQGGHSLNAASHALRVGNKRHGTPQAHTPGAWDQIAKTPGRVFPRK